MKPRTCKTCVWWFSMGKSNCFAARCVCNDSPMRTKIMSEADTCDKYEPKDRQRDLELK